MGFQVEKSDGITVVDVEGQLIVGNRQELKRTASMMVSRLQSPPA